MKHSPYIQLKTALKKNHITYQDISCILGISQSTVCNKILGTSDFYLSEVQTIEDVYGISYRFFMP